MKNILEKDLPYQVFIVIAALEILTLVALSPRTSGAEPLGFYAISCLRLLGLSLLGSFLFEDSPQHAMPVLTLWAIILVPPELWAFALEARSGIPLTIFSSLLAGFGAYGFARVFPSAAQIFPLLVVLALFFNNFQPSVYSLPMQLVLGSSLFFVMMLFFPKKAVNL